MRFNLTDEEWTEVEPFIPTKRKSARVDDRRVLNGILYVLRTGIPWRDLPEAYGPYTTVYNRFNRWAGRGIWKRIFERLAEKSRDPLHMMDSTVVKAHRAASGGKGGNGNKESGSAAVGGRRRFTPRLMVKVGL